MSEFETVVHEPVILERTFHAPVSRVWHALTDYDSLLQWYFPTLSGFEPRVGYEFQFTGGEPGKWKVHHCRITEVLPERKLQHTWSYEGHEGESLLTFELFDEGESMRLILTHEGIETFPALPMFAKHRFKDGWTEILDVSLKNYIEG